VKGPANSRGSGERIRFKRFKLSMVTVIPEDGEIVNNFGITFLENAVDTLWGYLV
jgi:hypothetical protein